MPTPVIDLFSGPGGLGEGFSAFNDGNSFRIVVSAEMESSAHATLLLRSYFRRVRHQEQDARVYFDFCNGKTSTAWNQTTKSAWEEAEREAQKLTLGDSQHNTVLDQLLASRIRGNKDCVLIGGPPCQAYSLVGRSRNQGNEKYRAEDDHRHFLYREYLRILKRYRPAVFVMENVRGILSARVGGRKIFNDILTDLADPDRALLGHGLGTKYRIHSLVTSTYFEDGMDPASLEPSDFVIRAENYGVPQARHRVILMGVRDDIGIAPTPVPTVGRLTVYDAIGDLPRLRSRLSKAPDSPESWAETVKNHLSELANDANFRGLKELAEAMSTAAERVRSDQSFGALRFAQDPIPSLQPDVLRNWYHDERLAVFLNHETRGHMSSDLRRYAYAAAYAQSNGVSPKGHDQFQLAGLRPDHANWETGKFSDRFRVQLAGAPSTTITSHISKDGHYFIHPDTSQCRSLTVREAARLQTFPDNYFFQGNRTQQFHQVGNAVPPILAKQVAAIVAKLIKQ